MQVFRSIGHAGICKASNEEKNRGKAPFSPIYFYRTYYFVKRQNMAIWDTLTYLIAQNEKKNISREKITNRLKIIFEFFRLVFEKNHRMYFFYIFGRYPYSEPQCHRKLDLSRSCSRPGGTTYKKHLFLYFGSKNCLGFFLYLSITLNYLSWLVGLGIFLSRIRAYTFWAKKRKLWVQPRSYTAPLYGRG